MSPAYGTKAHPNVSRAVGFQESSNRGCLGQVAGAKEQSKTLQALLTTTETSTRAEGKGLFIVQKKAQPFDSKGEDTYTLDYALQVCADVCTYVTGPVCSSSADL